jgi:hypothetical protein
VSDAQSGPAGTGPSHVLVNQLGRLTGRGDPGRLANQFRHDRQYSAARVYRDRGRPQTAAAGKEADGAASDERERLVQPNPGVVVVEETASPTGIPRHAYETPVFGIAPGVTELRWDSWPRIDDAIAGYQVFSALRAEGVIPGQLRFQVGLPFPSSALNGFKADFAADYPVAERAFEDLVARELTRLTAAIPPAELAIQWDLAYETRHGATGADGELRGRALRTHGGLAAPGRAAIPAQ